MDDSARRMPARVGIAVNPLQWLATEDGWLDFDRKLEREQLLSDLREAGYEGIMAEVPREWSLERYRRAVRDAGLGVAPGYFSVHLPEEGVESSVELERAQAAARSQAELGLRDIVIGSAMFKDAIRVQHPGQGREHDRSRFERLIQLIGEVSEAMLVEGIRPGLHPHVGTWIESEDESRAVLDAVDQRLLAFAPDIGHLSWAGADVVGMIGDYKDRVSVVHVKDCRLSVAESARRLDWTYQQAVLAGIWAEPGRGELNLESILSELPAHFSGWLIAEVDRSSLGAPLDSARAGAGWLRAFRTGWSSSRS